MYEVTEINHELSTGFSQMLTLSPCEYKQSDSPLGNGSCLELAVAPWCVMLDIFTIEFFPTYVNNDDQDGGECGRKYAWLVTLV